VLAYHICLLIFEDRWKSLLGAFLCIACSSFMFWATTAKEHMVAAAMLALVVFFFVRYLRRDSWFDAAGGFFCIGLLGWARPELGLTVAFFAGLFMIGFQMFRIHSGQLNPVEAIRSLSSMILLVIGSIPLLINNVITTGNVLVPVYILEESAKTNSRYADVISQVSPASGMPASGLDMVGRLSEFTGILGRHFSPTWNTLPSDMFGVFFYPETGHMGFVMVCPLALIAVALIILAFVKKQPFPAKDKPVLLFLALMTIAVMIAYLQSFPGMNTSIGVTPDMRYLMPAYLTAGILGVYMLNFHAFPERADKTLAEMFIISMAGVPIIILGMVAFSPFGGRYEGYMAVFRYCISFITVFFIAGFVLPSFRKQHLILLTRCLVILVIFVLSWQMMMVVLYSIVKFNGYSFWIPVTDTLYHQIIGVSPQ
jgi:hypothetical protein